MTVKSAARVTQHKRNLFFCRLYPIISLLYKRIRLKKENENTRILTNNRVLEKAEFGSAAESGKRNRVTTVIGKSKM